MLAYFEISSAPPRRLRRLVSRGRAATRDDDGDIAIVDRRWDTINAGGGNVAEWEVEAMQNRSSKILKRELRQTVAASVT